MATTEAPVRKRVKRGSSVATVAVLVIVGLSALVVVGLYGANLRAWWLLKPWSHDSLAQAAQRVSDALAAGDASTLEKLVNHAHVEVATQDDKLVGLTPKTSFNQGPGPTPVEYITPSQKAAEGEFEYSMPPAEPRAAVVMQAGPNYKTVFIFSPAKGGWLLDEANYLPKDGKRGVHWQF